MTTTPPLRNPYGLVHNRCMRKSPFHKHTSDDEYVRIAEHGRRRLEALRENPKDVPLSTDPVDPKILIRYGELYAWSLTEMAEALRLEHGVVKTRAGVSWILKQAGVDHRPKPESRDRLVPWKVAERWRNTALHRFLLTESRIRGGLAYALGEEEERNHARWTAELRRTNQVVDYSDARGFTVVPRRDGVDTDLVREP